MNVWNNSTAEVKPKDCHGLRKALSSIAQELQSFCTTDAIEVYSAPREVKSEEIFEKLNMVKLKLSSKNRQMKKLRQNFKTVCVVARSVMSAKDDETACLSNHIKLTRDQCECLLQRNKQNSKVIQDLQAEGQFLKDQMEAIEIFINLGYKELQKMRDVSYQNVSVMQKLREIMVCCGQYYTDFYSEQQKRQQLEQRNRYLTHKHNILTSSIEAISGELDTLRTQKIRLQTENESLKRKLCNAKPVDLQETVFGRSVCTFDNHKLRNKLSSHDAKCKNNPDNLNFSSHLTVIKKLLDDQEDMLKYLKQISDEITIQDYQCL